MVISRRNLIKLLAGSVITLLGSASLIADTANSGPQSFRTLAVRRAAPELYYQLGSKEIRLFASDSALSGLYEAPSSGKLELYTYTPADEPDLPPVKVVLAETQLKTAGESLLLIARMTSENTPGLPKIGLRTVDASVEMHPLNTMRVINFSNRRVASKVADEFAEIPSGGEYFFQIPPGNKVWVKVAAYEGVEKGWKLRNRAPNAVLPDTRSIMVLSDAFPSERDPKGENIVLRNVIDRNPPAPQSD